MKNVDQVKKAARLVELFESLSADHEWLKTKQNKGVYVTASNSDDDDRGVSHPFKTVFRGAEFLMILEERIKDVDAQLYAMDISVKMPYGVKSHPRAAIKEA